MTMLDKFLEIAHREQEKTASRDRYVELMMKLPVDELREIHQTGVVKLAFGEPACGPGGNGSMSWLDHFKDTPLYPQAIALEEEEVKLETARQQSNQVEQSGRDQMYQEQDALRVQKRLLEIELAKMQMQAESAAQPPPPPTPGMGPPGMGAQGAGAPGDMAPEGAQDGAVGKFASALRFRHARIKMAAKDPYAKLDEMQDNYPRPERGAGFLEGVGDFANVGARTGAGLGGAAGALHGAMKGHGVMGRIGGAVGHGLIGAGAGALAGGAVGGAAAAPGAAVGSMTESPLLGALLGGGAGYGLTNLLAARDPRLEGLAPIIAALSAGGGAIAGSRAQVARKKQTEHEGAMFDELDRVEAAEEKKHLRSKKKEASVGDFLRAAAPAVGNFVKEHPGAAIGGGLGALHGLFHHGGGIGSAVLEGAGGAALGHAGQHMYENGGAEKLRGVLGKEAPPPTTATATLEPEASGPATKTAEKKEPVSHRLGRFVGKHTDTFGGLTGAAGGAKSGHGIAKQYGVGPKGRLAAVAGGAAAGYVGGRAVGRFEQGVVSGEAHEHGPHKDKDEHEKKAFIGPLVAGAGKALAGAGGIGGLATKAMGFMKANPMKAVAAGAGAAQGALQAKANGAGMGGALLGAAAGGAGALG